MIEINITSTCDDLERSVIELLMVDHVLACCCPHPGYHPGTAAMIAEDVAVLLGDADGRLIAAIQRAGTADRGLLDRVRASIDELCERLCSDGETADAVWLRLQNRAWEVHVASP